MAGIEKLLKLTFNLFSFTGSQAIGWCIKESSTRYEIDGVLNRALRGKAFRRRENIGKLRE